MSGRRIAHLGFVGLFCATAGLAVLACGDDVAVDPPQRVTPFTGSPPAKVILSSACQHAANRLYPFDVLATCTEMFGTTTILNVNPPPATNVAAQFNCLGWGQSPYSAAPNYPVGEWDAVFTGHAFSIFSAHPPYVTVQMVDAANYVFSATGVRPTNPGSPIRIECHVDPSVSNAVAFANLTVNGPAAVLTNITLANPLSNFRPPQTVTITPTYKDNYNGLNLLSPTPATTWSANSTPAGAIIVSSGGVVSATARGSAVITAQSGSVTSPGVNITAIGCSSVSATPAGPITLYKTTTATSTASPNCDAGILTTTEPVTWTSANATIASVSMSGTGNHVVTITGINFGTTTVRACGVNPPLPFCSAPITVTVQAPVTTLSITGPSPITAKGTYDYNAVWTGFINPTYAWSERYCDAGTCTGWVNLGFAATATRVLTPDCGGSGSKTYELHLNMADSRGGASSVTKVVGLCLQ